MWTFLTLLFWFGITLGQDCKDRRWDEPDPIEENRQGQATQCDVLIGNDQEDVEEGEDFRLECNTRITDRIDRIVSECR